MRKPIILEGPDGIGKTTLINFLAQLYSDTEVISYTNKDNNGFNFWVNEYMLVDQKVIDGTQVIMSRSFLSELVYADIFSREPRVTEEEEAALVKLTQDKYDIIILLPRRLIDLKARLAKRGDYPAIIDNIDKIVLRYGQVATKYNLKVVYV